MNKWENLRGLRNCWFPCNKIKLQNDRNLKIMRQKKKKQNQKILNKFAYITPKYKNRYTESPKMYKTFEISPLNDFNL